MAICAGNSPVTGPRWIPLTKASGAKLWFFTLICVWINDWVNNREAVDLRCYRAHYDGIVMLCDTLRLQNYVVTWEKNIGRKLLSASPCCQLINLWQIGRWRCKLFSFLFRAIEFGGLMVKSHYIYQKCSSSFGWYIIAACVSTSVLGI